jgi:hypothetical protein
MERSRITAAGNTATHSLATTAIEPQSASLDSLHHSTAHRPILSFQPMWHQNEGGREDAKANMQDNRKAERMNRTVKEAIIKAFHYPDLDALRAHVLAFVQAYNFAKQLKAL